MHKHKGGMYELNVSPQNLYVEALIPSMTAFFGGRPLGSNQV